MEPQRLPIVLAHGIARFDILRQIFIDTLRLNELEIGDGLHYFKGIKSHLEHHGFEVHHTNVDFAAGVDRRAMQLSEQVDQILAGRAIGKVHIIAHSMGGLDARHMIVDVPGMAEKIASVTTIGTPHNGTTFADFGIARGAPLVIDALRSVIHLEGFKDLTTESCWTFNERARDAEARNPVRYETYASSEGRDAVFLPLQPSWSIIARTEPEHHGENDGLVSVASQLWTDVLVAKDGRQKNVLHGFFKVKADHLNEAGWWDPQETNPIVGLVTAAKEARTFEAKIKEEYLNIARNL